jgi:hypothetical protein
MRPADECVGEASRACVGMVPRAAVSHSH